MYRLARKHSQTSKKLTIITSRLPESKADFSSKL